MPWDTDVTTTTPEGTTTADTLTPDASCGSGDASQARVGSDALQTRRLEWKKLSPAVMRKIQVETRLPPPKTPTLQHQENFSIPINTDEFTSSVAGDHREKVSDKSVAGIDSFL